MFMRTALYIHYPFCLQKCLYCDFNSMAGSPVTPEDYAAALVSEMELRAAALPEPAAATTLYFGGGTPSLMEPALVERLVDAAVRCYNLEADAEITIEANPGTLTYGKLAGYRTAGVNRLSLGVQSFDDRMLTRMGRVHSALQAREAFAAARQVGFKNIGIDLIHSLPDQTPSEWLDDLQRGVDMGPEHIAAYGLTVEEGTPFASLAESGRLQLPGEDAALRMFCETGEFLASEGYEHYEISNFALPGRRSRHNQTYWRRKSYLGFGAGAHSFLASPGYGCRWKNPDDIPAYICSVKDGNFADENTSFLDCRDAMAEWLFLGLRMMEGVEEREFHLLFGASLEDTYPGVLTRLLESGLLERREERLRVSPSGLLVHNQVVMNFL